MNPTSEIATLTRIAASAGTLATTWFNQVRQDVVETRQKKPGEYVSDADEAVETHIRDQIADAYGPQSIVGEELGGQANSDYWSVDPIDGTSNFLRGSPLWGISIARIIDHTPVLGAIALPALGYLVAATAGNGLIVNGKLEQRPHASTNLIVAVGENPYWDAAEIGALERLLRSAGYGVASYRCASVSLAFTAIGIIDGYIEHQTNEWDIAAGTLLCREAGLLATATTAMATSDGPNRSILAGGPQLADTVESQRTGPTGSGSDPGDNRWS